MKFCASDAPELEAAVYSRKPRLVAISVGGIEHIMASPYLFTPEDFRCCVPTTWDIVGMAMDGGRLMFPRPVPVLVKLEFLAKPEASIPEVPEASIPEAEDSMQVTDEIWPAAHGDTERQTVCESLCPVM